MPKRPQQTAQELAEQSLAKGDATGWFEELYANANTAGANVPWARMETNPYLVEWLKKNNPKGNGKQALVVGCGLGYDAEAFAKIGFQVTAFDIAESAVKLCQVRFPQTAVNYTVGNLLDPSREWLGKFDFVYESLTVQSLPPNLQGDAQRSLARLITPDGNLLVMTWLRSQDTPLQGPPWLLTESDLQIYQQAGLHLVQADKTVPNPASHFSGLYIPKMAGV